MPKALNRRHILQGGAWLSLAPSLLEAACVDTPPSPFGDDSTAEEVTEGLDLTGKTALVTGVNSGIGYETMRVLALRGAHVLGTARTAEKGQVACDSVVGYTTPLVLELSDFDSVVACADAAQAQVGAIDMLICNAGVLLNELRQVRGLEMHFVVNHLGHFLLVNRLLEQVLAASEGRVVVVASRAHHSAPEDGIQFDNLAGEGDFDRQEFYGHSKLANGLFARELARRLEGTNATSNSLHPGVVVTNIARNLPGWQDAIFRFAGSLFLKSVEEGAATTCYVATSPELAGVNGCYFSDCNPVTPSTNMLDDDMAERLWSVSEQLTRPYLS
ncbi:MAG: SDR family oxidoreductase [Gammaproteobacteria bacterium]|nr:SDR family oxidoreductase [Gammaproteobacteria bacterium]